MPKAEPEDRMVNEKLLGERIIGMYPETKEEAGKETLAAAEITTSAENTKKSLFARIFHR